MSLMFFNTQPAFLKFMQEELEFTEGASVKYSENLVEYEESHEQRIYVRGLIHNPNKDVYHRVSYLKGCALGNSEFIISTTPLKLSKKIKIAGAVVNIFKPLQGE